MEREYHSHSETINFPLQHNSSKKTQPFKYEWAEFQNMQLLAITMYTWSRIFFFFNILVATKFKCDMDADVQEPKSCMNSNQLEVGRGKWEVHTALGLYYFIRSRYNPKVQLILGSRQTTETLQNTQKLAENTHCKWTSKKKTFPRSSTTLRNSTDSSAAAWWRFVHC